MAAQSFVAEVGGRLDVLLTKAFPDVSRARVARWVKQGAVEVDGVVAPRPALKVHAGVHITVVVPESVADVAVAQDLPLSIVYDDADIVVVDKAVGMVVHPASGHPDGTLVNALLHHVRDLSGIGGVQRPGIVHRLDRGTSGLVVVAKNDHAHQHLAAQFADHSAGRTYLALCHGVPASVSGTISSNLARHSKERTRFASTRDGSGKHAVTHWWRLGAGGGVSLVRCRLETGRTHQIRVHLTEAGWPLMGDDVYKRRNIRPHLWWRGLLPDRRPMLHAAELRLVHPATGEPCVFRAPPPPDMVALLDAAGIDLVWPLDPD